MARLPKNIIKKYGITKKAWQVFKGRKANKSSSTSRRVQTMTRKRVGKSRSFRRKAQGMLTGTTGQLLGAAAYGAIRERTSNALAPYTSKIPLGSISDEVGMLAVNWAIGKYVGRKVPILKPITKAGMLIEAARIGEAIADGTAFSSMKKQSGNSSPYLY